jgi:hypothetical protein
MCRRACDCQIRKIADHKPRVDTYRCLMLKIIRVDANDVICRGSKERQNESGILYH